MRKRSSQFTLKSHKELKYLTAAASRIINEIFMMHKQLNVWNAVHCVVWKDCEEKSGDDADLT